MEPVTPSTSTPTLQLLRRIPEWRMTFNAEINRIRKDPFSWGENDCGPGFAGKIAKALTGVNPAEQHMRKYKTEEEAYTYLQSLGFDDLLSATASILPSIQVSNARIGDIVAFQVDSKFRYALGVVNGETAFVRTLRSLASVDLLKADFAFKIG